MSLPTTIATRASHVGEHVVAITCVSTAELGCHKFIETFGDDVHRWPLAIYAVVALLVYAAGFASARFVRRLWRARRAEEASPPSPAALPEPATPAVAESLPTAQPARNGRDAVIAAAGGALIVAAVVAAFAGGRKT